MCRLKVEKLNPEDVVKGWEYVVDEPYLLSDSEEEVDPKNEALYELHLSPWVYPIPDDVLITDVNMAEHFSESPSVKFIPPVPVYTYTEFFPSGEFTNRFAAFTRQGHFEDHRMFPEKRDCFNVYSKFGVFDGGSSFPTINRYPKFLHLKYEDVPDKWYPPSRTIHVKNIEESRAWFCVPEIAMYSKYELCCPERCIVVVQRLGIPVCNNSCCDQKWRSST